MSFLSKVLVYLVSILAVAIYEGQARKHSVTQNPHWFFPRDWTQDVITLFIDITANNITNCTYDTTDDGLSQGVTFWLVQDENLTLLDDFDSLDPNLPTVYLLHGWLGDRNSSYISVIWQAYTRGPPKNLIVVDWRNYAKRLYPEAVCYVNRIGRYLARHLCDLRVRPGIRLEDVHLVGHSLGAQLAGITGYETQRTGCGTIDRITGLSPSGLLFQGTPPSQRLDASDANFVDVIHTDQGVYGYVGSLGDLDFYPNCGTFQPGCCRELVRNWTGNYIDNIENYFGCNHVRSCLLFAESITRNGFRSYNCPGCSVGICAANLFDPDPVYMGESARPNRRHRHYVLKTRARSPYGLGPVVATQTS